MIVKKLEELHEGAIGERGMFTHYNDNIYISKITF